MAITATSVRLIRSSQLDASTTIRKSDQYLVEAWATSWTVVSAALAPILLAWLKENESWPTRADLRTRRKLKPMFTMIGKATERLAALAEKEIAHAAKGVAERAVAAQDEIVASQLPVTWRPVVMESAADRLAAVTNRAARRARTLTRNIPLTIDRALRRTLVQGAPGVRPETAVRRMLTRMGVAYNTGLTRALTVLGTEVMDAHRAGSALGAATYADVVDGWIWTAWLSRDTCPACLSLHGTLHPLDELGPEGHPRCRCIRVPHTKSWKELGIDIGLDDPPEPEDMVQDAKDYFFGLPRADRLKIMGPTRLRLLEQEEIKWSDLAMIQKNPTWRDSYVTTPVRSLIRR